jgi:hypothetical protein
MLAAAAGLNSTAILTIIVASLAFTATAAVTTATGSAPARIASATTARMLSPAFNAFVMT